MLNGYCLNQQQQGKNTADLLLQRKNQADRADCQKSNRRQDVQQQRSAARW